MLGIGIVLFLVYGGSSQGSSQPSNNFGFGNYGGYGSSNQAQFGGNGRPSQNAGGNIVHISPPMFGLPAGFNPQLFGLDWDAQRKDCIDEPSCRSALAAYEMSGQAQTVSGASMPTNGAPYTVNFDPRLVQYAQNYMNWGSYNRPPPQLQVISPRYRKY